MEAPQTLRRPANWQDFESLCKKLWGEIWNSSDIRKNGRNGNNQHGVDVYGIPDGENQYYGIQCKGKDEYTDKHFTEDEINIEIEKAKSFLPPLKKYYLATTAVKNADIEQFVRQKNIESIKSGLFSIELYSWEDIVELIDENKRTHDWYIKNQNYKTQKSVSITFQNGEKEIICYPKFRKETINYMQKAPVVSSIYSTNSMIASFLKQQQAIPIITVGHSTLFSTQISLSYFGFFIYIHNSGVEPIEDYKLLFDFQGEICDLKNSNIKKSGIFPSFKQYPSTTYLWFDKLNGKIVPRTNILVGDDTMTSDEIFIKSSPQKSQIIINWKLISKDFKTNGQLILNVQPNIETEYKEVLVEDPLSVKVLEGEIEEYIVDKND